MGENICKHVSDKGLISRIYREFLKLDNKKTKPNQPPQNKTKQKQKQKQKQFRNGQKT